MPEILLLGGNGQVGWELSRALAPVGHLHTVTRRECDVADLTALRELVRSRRPAIIINATAYTAVDKAESEQEQAFLINAAVPAMLAEEAKRSRALLVDHSTDYVFDGSKATAYLEEDATGPLGIYGQSKLDGLRAIEASGCRHLVFRVSWVYAARGGNFLRTILRLAREREQLSVVADQIGAPTPAELIADVTAQCLMLLRNGKGSEGIYHLAPSGETSWYGFARAIVGEAQAAGIALKLTPENIRAITTAEYPTAAKRPANSCLATDKLRTTFGIALPTWESALPRIIRETPLS
ncbi:MAG TPA: dTDP-4-dehydrorhamnose reductase [Gammaproteobacteria bacterium]